MSVFYGKNIFIDKMKELNKLPVYRLNIVLAKVFEKIKSHEYLQHICQSVKNESFLFYYVCNRVI